jgi:serine/threonine-protein kinase
MTHRWPDVLPDGNGVLFTLRSENATSIAVQAMETAELRILTEAGPGGANPTSRYASSGHIVFERGGSLMAVPFDSRRLESIGSPVPVLDGVGVERQFSLSSDGTLAYIAGDIESSAKRTLARVDRQGAAQPLTEAQRPYVYPRFSPDGRRLAVTMQDPSPEIWILELGRDILTRLTFSEGGVSFAPAWSPDGRRILFSSNRVDGKYRLFSKPADGSGDAEQLTTEALGVPSSVSPDGKTVIFWHIGASSDIWTMRLDGEHGPEVLLGTPFDERCAMISPDGRWLAYVSNESGRDEVYVRSFPSPDRKWQVSREGGAGPVWAPNGEELFYRNGEKMMAIAISTEPDFTAQKPTLSFEGRYLQEGVSQCSLYDVSPDGRHFVMVQPEERSTPTQINVVINWFEELKRLVPTEN